MKEGGLSGDRMRQRYRFSDVHFSTALRALHRVSQKTTSTHEFLHTFSEKGEKDTSVRSIRTVGPTGFHFLMDEV